MAAGFTGNEEDRFSPATPNATDPQNRYTAPWMMPARLGQGQIMGTRVRANDGCEMAEECSGQIACGGDDDLEDVPQESFFFRYDSEKIT